jgi:catechol 2,3-dioxygenase-like lactoylglutathione lyase family enzyme
MLDHVSLPVADLERAAAFYDAVLATLGMARVKELPDAVGYASPEQPAAAFWLLLKREAGSAQPGTGLHVSFSAPDHESVQAFFDAAIHKGGRSAGPPGPRPEYTMPFYGAFAIDLDGFKIEAVCRRDE